MKRSVNILHFLHFKRVLFPVILFFIFLIPVFGQLSGVPVFKGHYQGINSIEYSPDGRYIATASADKSIKVWYAATGRIKAVLRGHNDEVLCVAFSPDGNFLVSGSRDETVKIWDIEQKNDIRTLRGHSGVVNAVDYSPDGEYVVSASSDNTLRIWSTGIISSSTVLRGHADNVLAVKFSPDGSDVISGSKDQTLKLWKTSSGNCYRTLRGHSHYVMSVDIDYNGEYILSGSFDKTVKLWNSRSTRCQATFGGHEYAVNSVSFSPDGKTFVSGSDDNTIKLWDIESQSEIYTHRGHSAEVTSVDFSPNGKHFVSSAKDCAIQMWESNDYKKPVYVHHNPVESKSTSQEAPKIWAVIVGIAKYNHASVLEYSDDDAYQIYAYLRSPEGGAIPDSQIKLLVDSRAKKDNILAAMDDVFNRAGSNDMVLFFFSGHGVTGAFLPYDFNGKSYLLSHKEIKKRFESSAAKHKLCIADACFAGSLNEKNYKSPIESTTGAFYSALKYSTGGEAYFVSSKPEEKSIEYQGLRHGVFSHYLIRGLNGEANANGDKIITINELYEYVTPAVESYTGKYQHPVIYGKYDNNMPVGGVR